MKFGNTLYIAVALFMVMGISAMAAYPETSNNIGENVKKVLDSPISFLTSTVSSVTGGNTESTGSSTEIPEFPALIIPVATTIGLMFLFQHKKTKEKK